MKRIIISFVLLLGILPQAGAAKKATTVPAEVKLSKEVLMDKIKGAWAGQIIGCTYGGPTEFRFATTINDNIPIRWDEHRIKWYYDNIPGLYDDVYMDLTFVDVFAKEGLDAPVTSFANAFANAGYPLWHANQAARYNILHGIMPPASGFWKNNPHADDIDFQIEADYAGIMSPGMPNMASHFSDEIGHIMNYGDGWYGGVYVANMYALAFVSNDIEFICTEALKSIPEQSRYYKCMADVIAWHKQYPSDWEIAWALANKKYGFDIGCPSGVWNAFNIDAVINSVYIIIGLLYGEGDFGRTIDISTRCGHDSDCNPASSGGILATVLGYDRIPDYWKKPLEEVADRNFKYTDISFNKACELSFNQACQVIERAGGKVSKKDVKIKTQTPKAVRFEEGFAGIWPKERIQLGGKDILKIGQLKFDGIGVVVGHRITETREFKLKGYEACVEVWLDGKLDQVVMLPVKANNYKQEIYNNYDLAPGEHTLDFKWTNPVLGVDINLTYILPYEERPKDIKTF